MIPFIRSLSELTAITESRETKPLNAGNDKINISTVDSGQRKRYIRSLEEEGIDLPNLPKTIRRKWIRNKEFISRFLNDLDYNNHIQSSYDITLLEIQNKSNERHVA